MTPNTLLFPDGSSTQPLWFKVFADEEVSTVMDMTHEECGLFTKLRWYAVTRGSFSGDADEMWPQAKNFCGISRFKFRKLLPRVLKYFTQTDDGFCFGRDEERVSESRSNIAKARKSGQIGAQARWGSRTEPPRQPTPISDATAYADQPTSRSREDIGVEPPPPTDTRELGDPTEVVGGGGPTQTTENTEQDGYQEFAAHCKDKGLPAGTRKLWSRIKTKFPGSPTADILKNLPKFDEQYSPGLWDNHSQQALFNESQRKLQPEKKPAARKSQATLMLEETARRLGVKA